MRKKRRGGDNQKYQTLFEDSADQRPVIGLIIGLTASSLVAVGMLISLTSALPERNVIERPIQVADDGYASSDACQACHPREYAAWRQSYHRTMTQVATRESVIADFGNVEVREVPGRPMSLERRGNQFWATLDDPDWDGDAGTKPRIERQVVLTTGSHHQQIYWYATGRGRLLGQLPAEYLVEERRWVPRSAVLMHPPTPPFSETGSWNSTCIACHATLGKPRLLTPPGTAPNRTRVGETQAAEFGISCESCHGPSAEHARLNRNPWRRYSLHLTRAQDETTALPDQFTPQRSSQVCGQCHSVWEFINQAGERQANAVGLPYRPGDELTATRLVVQPTRAADSSAMTELIASDPQFIKDSFWSDGMIRVSGREYNGLIESPCFKNARDDGHKLSCSSCHEMHKAEDDVRSTSEWANAQLAPGMDGNAACLQCHKSYGTDVAKHSKHSPSSAGSSCYNCHMPYTTYGLMKTLRSHQISSPSVAVSLTTGRPNACNLCHLDKTLKWASDALQKLYGIPAPALAEDDTEIAASLLLLLRGDAGQRAVVAQSMGWPPAQKASGSEWMAPYLAQLLDDPYEALRFIVYRSLRLTPGFDDFVYDFTASHSLRVVAANRAMDNWRMTRDRLGRLANPELLLDASGNVRLDVVNRLVQGRNNRPVFLRE
jgi:hypothetical protein